MEKEKLTFWEILFEGIKKFAGEIIGALLLAVFLYCFPNLRSLFTDYNLPGNSETQSELELHRQEEERLKAELQRKEEALKEAEEARQRAEAQRAIAEKTKPTPKLPAMSDSDFLNLCKSDNTAKIEAAIKNSANVNARNNNGMTALRWARDEKTRHLLCKYGATK